MGDVSPAYKITLRAARLNSNLSLEDVAAKLKMSEDDLMRYEKDSRIIPYDEALRLFKLYGLESVHVHIGVDSETLST